MNDKIEAVRIDHQSGSGPIVHFSDGSSAPLSELVEQAFKWRHAKSPGAVDRAMNREQHASERAKRAEQHEAAARGGERVALHAAATLKRKLGKVIEQAGAWKRRALAAESALELAREQARHREAELVRAGHQQLLEAQARALMTIMDIVEDLRGGRVIDAEVVVPDVEVDTWFGEDNTPVVQIDTPLHHGRLRINLNDGVVWDGDPETDERPGAHAEALPTDRQLTIHIGGQQGMKATISRQLDTIRDQAEKIEELVQALKNRNGEGDPADPGAHGGAIPRYGMLDLWQAIHDSSDVRAFDHFYAERGYAEAWARLLATVRERRSQLTAATQAADANGEALAKAAKLRDRQVEALSRLWVAKTDDERSLFGTVFTKLLYRVFADHGIDVEHDMPAYPANVGVLITPAERLVTQHAQLARAAQKVISDARGAYVGSPKLARSLGKLKGALDHAGKIDQPVTDRMIREYNHLREHAELVATIGVKATGPFYPAPLRDAIKELNGALKNGAPEPTPDITDCA